MTTLVCGLALLIAYWLLAGAVLTEALAEPTPPFLSRLAPRRQQKTPPA